MIRDGDVAANVRNEGAPRKAPSVEVVMTRWLTPALTLTLLIAFTGLATAQMKAAPRRPLETPPQEVPSGTTAGTVTAVDNISKTFTVNAGGRAVTFSALNITLLPKIGESVEVSYHGGRGGMPQATTVKSSKSNTDNLVGGGGGDAQAPRVQGAPFGHNAALPRASVVAGKVTNVDHASKTFTMVENGKPVTVNATNIAALPKVGDLVEVTHSGVPGGVLFATTVKSSKSNTSE